jgi:hypothetical protein
MSNLDKNLELTFDSERGKTAWIGKTYDLMGLLHGFS